MAALLVCVLVCTAAGGVSVSVDGQVGEEVILKVGQAAVVWISSDDSVPYSAYVGFEEGTALPGKLHSPAVYTTAGNLASASPISAPPLDGYYVNAAGTSPAPSPGIHFHFVYTASKVGQAALCVYDEKFTIILGSITITVEAAEAGAGFTYQGRLLNEDKAANGLFDLRLELFDTPSDGKRIAETVELAGVNVQDGYFTVRLDFGDVFGGQARWLQTNVRASGSKEDYTCLSPRQRITPAPQATYAASAGRAEQADLALGVQWADVKGIPADIANYVAPNIATGRVPYFSGAQLVSSPMRSDGEQIAIGTDIDTGRKLTVYTDSNMHGIYARNARTGTGFTYGVAGLVIGSATGPNYGLYGRSSSSAGDNYGVRGLAETSSTGTNYGVYGSALNYGSGDAYAGYFDGRVEITDMLTINHSLIASMAPDSRVKIGTTLSQNSKVNVHSSLEYGIRGASDRSVGTRYGVYGETVGSTASPSYGVFGRSESPSGHNYGVYGRATQPSSGSNIGVFGRASNTGAGPAYAGYFVGRTVLDGSVGIMTTEYIAGRLINTNTGAYLSTGGTWVNASNRERKENFEAVDGRAILEALVRVPVSTWNYKTEDVSVRHMGPMSQDLYAAFRLSGDDESISTVDTAGLSFAAIQGLYEVVAEKEAELAAVRRENEEIKERLAAIEARLAALAGQI